MVERQDSSDAVAIAELNGDLRHAQAELQAAQRATQRLRGRFTAQEIARHAEPEVLTTAQATVVGLHEYFSSIPPLAHLSDGVRIGEGPELSESQILDAITDIAAYMREQRDKYRAIGDPLDAPHATVMGKFFSPSLLARIRVVQLAHHGLGRLEVKAKPHTYRSLLQLTHMASVTFEDVVVFNELLTRRVLFHALVHAVQLQLMGLPRYTELFVRAFVATRWRFNVPLEAHAFELESRFAADPSQPFFVEDEVRLWIERERY